ncbi:hypothetical protein DET1229 [Dehalococcoides mccartyi 195]|uniref:Uncharacterized protein n=1 Tax=Dehalococcoides mccartyi (strain ATCC BAA-2266 / KCTC 15142 / 195) TaxID=243164 RepID=Q3Z757_DEHM1|nr:hypothetical protein DET1229 [Dehalococcoides mccartyi 195]
MSILSIPNKIILFFILIPPGNIILRKQIAPLLYCLDYPWQKTVSSAA